jgi:hypothetical protein
VSRVWACVRLAVGVATAMVIVVRLGAGPFLTGLRSASHGRWPRRAALPW